MGIPSCILLSGTVNGEELTRKVITNAGDLAFHFQTRQWTEVPSTCHNSCYKTCHFQDLEKELAEKVFFTASFSSLFLRLKIMGAQEGSEGRVGDAHQRVSFQTGDPWA